MYSLARLTVRLVLRHNIGRIIVSLLLILGGLFYGSTSHTSTYQLADAQSYQLYSIDDGTYLFQSGTSDTYYIIKPQDFTPNITDNDLKGTGTLAILYKDDTQSVEFQADDGTQISGNGYQVEKIAIADANSKNAHIFKNAEYIQNPDSVYTNNWWTGGIVALAGLLLLLLSVIFPFFKRTKQSHAAINSNAFNPYDLSSANQANPTQFSQDQVPNPYAPMQDQPNPYAPIQDQPNPYAPPMQKYKY